MLDTLAHPVFELIYTPGTPPVDRGRGTPMTRTATAIRKSVEIKQCACGTCVETTRGTYAPGHDARHAGLVARDVVRTGDMDLLRSLPSAALRAKATAMATRLAEPRAARPVKRTSSTVEGTVKVGRWTYPARKLAGGEIVRNTKRDGSGEWTRVEGVEFAQAA